MSLFNFFKKNETPGQTKNYYKEEKVELPVDFAQRVMELQMQTEFEESCDIEVVQQLNQLYRMAIQHYSTVDGKKAQHFHRKLTALLTNPNTIDVIQKKQNETKVKQSPIDPSSYEKSLKHELHVFNSQSGVMVKSMIEGTNKRMQYHNRLIDKNISKQEDTLQKRLEERSRSKKKRN